MSYFFFRSIFSREKTLLWFGALILGFMACREPTGAFTSIVRALGLGDKSYLAFLSFFSNMAANPLFVRNLQSTLLLWIVKAFKNRLFRLGGRAIVIVDGKKVPKEGDSMPAVKLMHQESNDNAKKEFIFGHHYECLGLVTKGLLGFICLPFACFLVDGFKHFDKETWYQRLFAQLGVVFDTLPGSIFVFDAGYKARAFLNKVSDKTSIVVAKIAFNSVAYEPAGAPDPHRRGPKPKYGLHIILNDLFKTTDAMVTTNIRMASGQLIEVSYWTKDLFWPDMGFVKFVGYTTAEFGKAILVCSDIKFVVEDVIRAYMVRTTIESAFWRLAVGMHAWGYRFWTKQLDGVLSLTESINLSEISKKKRLAFEKMIRKYEIYVTSAFVAHAMIIYVQQIFGKKLILGFKGWFRTIRIARGATLTLVQDGLGQELAPSSPQTGALGYFISEKRAADTRDVAKMIDRGSNSALAPP